MWFDMHKSSSCFITLVSEDNTWIFMIDAPIPRKKNCAIDFFVDS